MSRTFKDSLAYDAENVLLNANEFAEEVTHRIRGSLNDTETLTVDIDWSMLQEPQGGVGQAQDRGGQRANQDVKVEVLSSVDLYEEKCQFVTSDGVVLHFVKIIGRDESTKTALCRAAIGITSKQTRVRQ